MDLLSGYSLDFALPPELEASSPPEARGLKRDQVRLMVTRYTGGPMQHTRFDSLPDILQAGDVIVLNTSGTRNAALRALREDSTPLELHLSTQLEDGSWTVEPRSVHEDGKTGHFEGAIPGDTLLLPAGASV